MAHYECVASSVEGFVQRLALDYVRYGYWFYVAGCIRDGLDPEKIDRDILSRYEVNISRWTRYRRAKRGFASVHYLRFERFYVLIASEGQHLFRDREADKVKDIRETPIRFAGYSIGYKRSRGGNSWHPSVRVERNQYRVLKREFLDASLKHSVKALIKAFRSLPFEPYAPVRCQVVNLLRLVNDRRKAARLPLLPVRALRFKRRSVRRFEPRRRTGFDKAA
jgi:hypothetical protein